MGLLLLIIVGCSSLFGTGMKYWFSKDESYKCLESGKYSLDLKQGGYWVCLFPRWTSLGLVKTTLPTAVTVVLKDKEGIEVEQSHGQLLGSGTYLYPDSGSSRYQGYDYSSFIIKQKGVHVLEYQTNQACLLVIVPASSVAKDLGSRTKLIGVFNENLKSANYKHPDSQNN